MYQRRRIAVLLLFCLLSGAVASKLRLNPFKGNTGRIVPEYVPKVALEQNGKPLAPVSDDEEPGVQVVARQRLFDFAMNQTIQIVEQKVQNLCIASYTKTFNLPLIGDFEIRLSNITVTEFHVPAEKSQLKILSGKYQLQATDIMGSVEFSWHWEKLKMSGTGSGELLLQGGTLDYLYDVHQSDAGQPVLNVLSASSDVGSLDLTIHAFSADWFYQAVMTLFKGAIISAITNAVNTALNHDAPEQVNKVLASLPTNVTVQGLPFETVFSYSLYTDSYVLVKGYSLVEADPVAANGAKCPLPMSDVPMSPDVIASEPHMVSIMLHENTLNCLLWGLERQGMLNIIVKDGVIPNLRLTTDLFAALIPGLPKLYPKRPLQLGIKTLSPPLVYFSSSNGTIISVSYRTSVYVVPASNDSTVPDPIFITSVISDLNITGDFQWDSSLVTNLSATYEKEPGATLDVSTTAWNNLFVWLLKNYAPKYTLHKIFNMFVKTPVASEIVLESAHTDVYDQWYSLSTDIQVDGSGILRLLR